MKFFQLFDSREKKVCKMGQTSHDKFIRSHDRNTNQ